MVIPAASVMGITQRLKWHKPQVLRFAGIFRVLTEAEIVPQRYAELSPERTPGTSQEGRYRDALERGPRGRRHTDRRTA